MPPAVIYDINFVQLGGGPTPIAVVLIPADQEWVSIEYPQFCVSNVNMSLANP